MKFHEPLEIITIAHDMGMTGQFANSGLELDAACDYIDRIRINGPAGQRPDFCRVALLPADIPIVD